MFFSANSAQIPGAAIAGHWDQLWANRNIWNLQNERLNAAFRPAMTANMLEANAWGAFGNDFWKQIDREIIASRDQTFGMEILADLQGVQKTLDIGKTASLYTVRGDIADDVSVSIDGQSPYSFDHTDFGDDGDPIPVFTAGFGVNWRLAKGLNTVGIDLVLESQAAKQDKYNRQLVAYLLDGSPRIAVSNYPGQGLRNHRNTTKINLGTGAGGVGIDLTTATLAEMLEFFGPTGAFGINARNNGVNRYDVLWVSAEIYANMTKSNVVNVGSGSQVLYAGTDLDVLSRTVPAESIRPTFALSGNEFLGYQRRRDVVRPLVGMTTGVVPVPRFMPQDNFNFQIMGAMGVQVTRDEQGRGGVVYGKNLG